VVGGSGGGENGDSRVLDELEGGVGCVFSGISAAAFHFIFQSPRSTSDLEFVVENAPSRYGRGALNPTPACNLMTNIANILAVCIPNSSGSNTTKRQSHRRIINAHPCSSNGPKRIQRSWLS